MDSPISHTRWPFRGWVGLALVAVFWALNWSLSGMRSHWGFFPLWLGYCLTVDAGAYYRTGTSLWTRSRTGYAGLFLVSAPAWWLFEAINWRTANWFYEGRSAFTDLEYIVLASVSFSTVMPAVFGTGELAATFSPIRRFGPRSSSAIGAGFRYAVLLTGVAMLALLLFWPRYFFPLVWVSLFCILDPLNDRLGNRSLIREAARGEWRSWLALATGSVVCGFFWEMWNFYSYPKWIYQIPFVDFFRVFEMPILGYGGYIPFALELFAMYHFVTGLLGVAPATPYIRLISNKA